MTKQEALDKVMTYNKRIERLERCFSQVEELQSLLGNEFNMGNKSYYDPDYYIAQEIFDAFSNILDCINCEIGDIEKEAAA